jgi:hypothetical protein
VSRAVSLLATAPGVGLFLRDIGRDARAVALAAWDLTRFALFNRGKDAASDTQEKRNPGGESPGLRVRTGGQFR